MSNMLIAVLSAALLATAATAPAPTAHAAPGTTTATAPAKAPKSAPGSSWKPVVPFIDDDFGRALALAKSRKLPVFIEGWAPW